MVVSGNFIWGYTRRRGGLGKESHGETHGEALVGMMKQFADIVCLFLPAEMINIRKFCTVHLLILDQCVSRWGLSDFLGARPPSPFLALGVINIMSTVGYVFCRAVNCNHLLSLIVIALSSKYCFLE